MVQLMKTGKVRMESELIREKMVPVKLEVEDSLEDQYGPVKKRSKPSTSLQQQQQQQQNLETADFPVPPSQYNPLDEPSPLGLRLRKSPSLLDLIQMRLSQANAPKIGTNKKDQKSSAASGTIDKLKASNFPATLLRIGNWEYISRYEGDLVAKCYFAKHKLVWEVLDGGLKNKIEIQWSDIMALKGNYPDDEPGTLVVVLARQPLFYRETNPQPRKHTIWQATSDFTNGQASLCRRHYLQCPQGLLGKHFEKLIQCDPRLNFLSQQGETILESPYFEPRISVFDDSNEHNNALDLISEGRAFSDLRDAASPSGAQSSSSMSEQQYPFSIPAEGYSHETLSPSSVMDTHAIEGIRSTEAEGSKLLSKWEQIKLPGLHPSMSMSDLVSHLEHRISEQTTSNNPVLSSEEKQSLEILEDISRCLFSETQHMPASDEKSLMSRVNSLCCLLQKDPVTVQNLPTVDEMSSEPNSLSASSSGGSKVTDSRTPEGESNDVPDHKQAPGMSRIDSVGELLLNLPRITSLPQFFFNISDYDNQAR